MVLAANHSTRVTVDSKECVYFGGTNYLGMAHRPELAQAVAAAFENYGFSSGASRLTSGETSVLLELEAELASFAEAEAAVVLPAGFISNEVVVDAIDELVDVWIASRQPHASIVAALQSTRKPVHNIDTSSANSRAELCAQLGIPQATRMAVFAEPIDAMNGTVADIAALHKLCGSNDFLILDEAHSFGVLGENGKGACERFHLPRSQSLIRTGTFSKALGAYGGFVLAPSSVIERAKQLSPGYRGSTSLPPLVCAAALQSLRLLIREKQSTLGALHRNIAFMNDALEALGIAGFLTRETPIFNLPPSPVTTKARRELDSHGIYIPAISGYFADACEIGLRFTLQAGHTENDLRRLVDVIAAAKNV